MQPFTLRAALRTPLLARGHLTLDALLMAVLDRDDVSDLLLCVDGLYHASAAIPVGDGLRHRAAFVASMRPSITPEWLDVIKPNSRAGTDVAIGSTRQREAGNVLNAYHGVACQAVEWHATGDMCVLCKNHHAEEHHQMASGPSAMQAARGGGVVK